MRVRLWSSLLGLAGLLALLVGINLYVEARLDTVRADLTQNHIYTLSPGTRKILAGLKQPITLRLFYSRALGAAAPTYGTYADHVRTLLREYAQAARGKIRLEMFNPLPFSTTEDQAVADGLQGVPLNEAGEKVYFGLAGSNLLNDQRVIPFFQPDRERFLEYDLTKVVYELSNPKRPVVGIMSPLPWDGNTRLMMMALREGRSPGQAGQPFASTMLLRQTDKVVTVPTTATMIPKDVRVLMLADPQHLSLATQYAIDQFVMHGGRLMVLVDPWSDTLAAQPNPTGTPPTDTGSDLPRLFKAWGIEFNPKEVVGDLDGAWQVETQAGGTTNYVAWFNIRRGINHDDPATADLQQVSVATPGFIAKVPGAKITFTPLLESSAQSGLIPVSEVKMPHPAQILARFHPSGGPRVIAARIRGVLHSAFTGPPPLAKGETRPPGFPAFKATTSGPADLVVIADSDLLANRFWLSTQNFFGRNQELPFSDNGPFIANLVDTLSGSNALLSLRGRGTSIRPFTVIDHMQAVAQARFRKTEEALKQHLAAVQKRLETLRRGSATGTSANVQAIITPAQRQAITAAREDILATRARLRTVQFDLNRAIAALKMRLMLFNILLVPLLLSLGAIGMALLRRQRRARARP